ncbi:MAG: FAD-dependent oxidoreductase [Lachnospiraceae bacterium]|nr:FAD-dependent oxidoreductase [Lachnospiraceae bacterium]
MIQLSSIKIPVDYIFEKAGKQPDTALEKNALLLYLNKQQPLFANNITGLQILKRSIDSRRRGEISYIYTLALSILNEADFIKSKKFKQLKNASVYKPVNYDFKPRSMKKPRQRIIITGFGPAGMFCALMLARLGLNPLVLERGEDIDHRVKTVEQFWKGAPLSKDSNVQFGEGGAGTFSDGKLNTGVKDQSGRKQQVLKDFVEFGAPEDILYVNKPHIGTDCLRNVVKNIRKEIIRLGGEIRFLSKVTDFSITDGKVTSVTVNDTEIISCDALVLAIGHSARDTFSRLYEKKLAMEQKPFAVGVRMEHLQSTLNQVQYRDKADKLPSADYKVTYQTESGRGVYSFCMCPGGFVVNASSEENALVVNGMSNRLRDEKNANSAIVVTVDPKDFANSHPLAGMYFQRELEQRAYSVANGQIPVQRFGDFQKNQATVAFGKVTPNTKGNYVPSNVRKYLPDFITDALLEAIPAFEHKIAGFADEDALLAGIETRTSSPIRILRNEQLQTEWEGIFPCGEGAGYAGGIVSAAMDGIKVSEAVAMQFIDTAN